MVANINCCQQSPGSAPQGPVRVSGFSQAGRINPQQDRITLQGGSPASSITYSSDLLLDNDEESRYGLLRELVTNLLREQGLTTLVVDGETEIDLPALTPEEASELVADDGYFGVEQTSERIFQFAVGIAGGDPARIDAIKEGIDRGFQEALEAFNGYLPDISYETYDAVMEKLDNWVAESQDGA